MAETQAFQWIPTWQGLDGFQRSRHPCALDESSLSIGRVREGRQNMNDLSPLRCGNQNSMITYFRHPSQIQACMAQLLCPLKCGTPILWSHILHTQYQNLGLNALLDRITYVNFVTGYKGVTRVWKPRVLRVPGSSGLLWTVTHRVLGTWSIIGTHYGSPRENCTLLFCWM